MKPLTVRLIVILGVLSVSTAAIAVKLSDAIPLHNAFYRMLFAFLLMLPLLWKSRASMKSISTKHWFWMIVSGIALGMHFFTWFISLEHTSIANSMVLICMSPIFTVSGGALFFGTKFKKQELLMTFTAIIGGVIMALHTGGIEAGEFYGNMMAIVGTFCIAVYLLIGGYVRASVSTILYTTAVYGFAAATLFIVTLFQQESLTQQTGRSWMVFLWLALIPTLMGHSLFSYSLKYVKAAYISTAVLFEPVLTIILAMFLFKEYPDVLQILGGSIILISLGIYTLISKNEPISD